MKITAATLLLASTVLLCSCQNENAVAPVQDDIVLKASVQELMKAIVDPAADAVWESVGSTITTKGIDDRQPRTAEEWQEARNGAIALIEATNLLAMKGRRLVPVGGKILDEGSDGVLTTADGEALLASQHATFVQMARALRASGEKMLQAIDAKDATAMMDVGGEMDEVCESCHMTFWYPNQPVYSIKLTAGSK